MAAPVPIQAPLTDEADFPIQRIRVETALSRFPIHRLAKDKREFSIDLERISREGQVDFQWKTSFNSRYGPPGLLAYKLDTLLINRLLDEAPRPLPEYLRLGSLLEISRGFQMEESGSNTTNIRRALMQSASTFIEASIKFRDKDGRESRLEIGGTRYSVILTGKDLPDGRKADAVYIVLNPWFRDLQEKVQVRPLDYNYLSLLPGAAQRLYELLSFPMYGALLNGRSYATLLYSEFCALCPITRHLTYDRMKKQMGKIHAEHHLNKYILRPVAFEDATPQPRDGKSAEPDWLMKYAPGPRARKEFDIFMRRGTATMTLSPELAAPPRKKSASEPAPTQETLDFQALENSRSNLVGELVRRGVQEDTAIKLLDNLQPGQQPLEQIEYVDMIVGQGSITNPPGLYINFLKENRPAPETFLATRRRKASDGEPNPELDQEYEGMIVGLAYEEYVREQTDLRFATLSEPEQEQWIDRGRKDMLARYPKLSEDQQHQIGSLYARVLFRESGQVPVMGLDEFRRQHAPPQSIS